MLQGSKVGRCDEIEIEFSVESEAGEAVITEMLRAAHQMCFTEDALTHAVKVTKKHSLNGRSFEV